MAEGKNGRTWEELYNEQVRLREQADHKLLQAGHEIKTLEGFKALFNAKSKSYDGLYDRLKHMERVVDTAKAEKKQWLEAKVAHDKIIQDHLSNNDSTVHALENEIIELKEQLRELSVEA